MRTTETPHAIFLHNSDYSGNIEIRVKGETEAVSIPFEDLRAFVAKYVRKERICKLELASDNEVLGLPETT